MASVSLARESCNDAVEKALEALKDSSIDSLTKYQSKALFHVLNVYILRALVLTPFSANLTLKSP